MAQVALTISPKKSQNKLPTPRLLHPSRPTLVKTRIEDSGDRVVISTRSAPRMIRRRAYSLADIPDSPEKFTYSPRTFREQNPPPREREFLRGE